MTTDVFAQVRRYDQEWLPGLDDVPVAMRLKRAVPPRSPLRRNPEWPAARIVDYWYRRDGAPRPSRGKSLRWQVHWIDPGGEGRVRKFRSRPDAVAYLERLNARACAGIPVTQDLLCIGHSDLRDVQQLEEAGRFVVQPGRCMAVQDTHASGRLLLCGSRRASRRQSGLILCEVHYEMELSAAAAELQRRSDARKKADREQAASSWKASGANIVYYVRRGDGLIKIGTTTNPQGRLSHLRSEHGPLEILLTHCGDRERELATHIQFWDLNVQGEWFRAGEELMAWILEKRQIEENVATVIRHTVPLSRVIEIAEAEAASSAA